MSDEDNFVQALRAIDGKEVAPLHCTGHMHRMRIHEFVGRAVDANGVSVWRLTEEGHARAYPQRGRLRVTVERVRMAINYESGSSMLTSCVLHKTRAARTALRNTWYTPDYAKTIRSGS